MNVLCRLVLVGLRAKEQYPPHKMLKNTFLTKIRRISLFFCPEPCSRGLVTAVIHGSARSATQEQCPLQDKFLATTYVQKYFYREMLRRARYNCHGKSYLCSSVCPSVTLRYRIHVGIGIPPRFVTTLSQLPLPSGGVPYSTTWCRIVFI